MSRIEGTPNLYRAGTPGAEAVARAFGFVGAISVEEVAIARVTTSSPKERWLHFDDGAGPFRTVRREPELLRRGVAPAVAQPGPGAAAVGVRHRGRVDRRRRPRDLGGLALPQPAPGDRARSPRRHSPAHLQPPNSRTRAFRSRQPRVRFARVQRPFPRALCPLEAFSGAQLAAKIKTSCAPEKQRAAFDVESHVTFIPHVTEAGFAASKGPGALRGLLSETGRARGPGTGWRPSGRGG